MEGPHISTWLSTLKTKKKKYPSRKDSNASIAYNSNPATPLVNTSIDIVDINKNSTMDTSFEYASMNEILNKSYSVDIINTDGRNRAGILFFLIHFLA